MKALEIINILEKRFRSMDSYSMHPCEELWTYASKKTLKFSRKCSHPIFSRRFNISCLVRPSITTHSQCLGSSFAKLGWGDQCVQIFHPTSASQKKLIWLKYCKHSLSSNSLYTRILFHNNFQNFLDWRVQRKDMWHCFGVRTTMVYNMALPNPSLDIFPVPISISSNCNASMR
jgi:hypothetical protein